MPSLFSRPWRCLRHAPWLLISPLLLAAAPSNGALDDARFQRLVDQYLEESFARQPTWATSIGRHDHDARLEDYTLAGQRAAIAALRANRQAVAAIAPGRLSEVMAADRAWLLGSLDSELLTLEELRPLERDPDRYAAGIAAAAFSLVARDYAPAEKRLDALLGRLERMPAALRAARTNLKDPPRVYTQVALDQLPGAVEMFETTLPAAFAHLPAPRVAALRAACAPVIQALRDHERFLREAVLPRSTGSFALGEARFRRKLLADDLIDVAPARLLALGEAALARDQQALREAAALIDPRASVEAVFARLGDRHVPAAELITSTQATLGGIARFIEARRLMTLPSLAGLRVVETPAFMRATTTAAMDMPGPFEAAPLPSFYFVTPPNPAWPAAEQADYMKQWTVPMIANLSVHEAYPGHFVQDQLRASFPTKLRRLLWAPTNGEGWAHYCEQMMVEAGYLATDPRYRIAQLQDALLRDARLVVGVRMHTRGMSVEEATRFFEREAFQSLPSARSEAWRGTNDPTYGYYTLGKLMIYKLREDYQRRQGAAYTLGEFHDRFLALGPLPLPLVRQAMLGASGDPFGREASTTTRIRRRTVAERPNIRQ